MLQWFTVAAAGTLSSGWQDGGRRWQWKGAIKVNSEVSGKWGVCVVNVSGVLRFPVWPTGIVLLYDGFLALHCSILTFSAKCFLCRLRPLVASHRFVSMTVSSDFSFVSGKLQHLSFCRGPFLPWEPFLCLTDCGFCFWQLAPVMTRWNGILLRVHREDAGAAQLSKHSMAYPLRFVFFILFFGIKNQRGKKIEQRLIVVSCKFSCVCTDWCQLTNLFYFSFSSWEEPSSREGFGGKYSWNVNKAQLQNDWCNALSHFQEVCGRMFWILSFISIAPLAVVKLSLLLQRFISSITTLRLRDSCYFKHNIHFCICCISLLFPIGNCTDAVLFGSNTPNISKHTHCKVC